MTFYGANEQYRMHIKLSQGSNVFEYDVCNDESYRQQMQQALNYGMAVALVYWGDSYGDMQWLDGMTGCNGDCPGTGNVVFRYITSSSVHADGFSNSLCFHMQQYYHWTNHFINALNVYTLNINFASYSNFLVQFNSDGPFS